MATNSNSQDKPRRRRVPLGEPLTAVDLAQRVGGTEPTPSDAMEAQALWEVRAPTYARQWTKAKKP